MSLGRKRRLLTGLVLITDCVSRSYSEYLGREDPLVQDIADKERLWTADLAVKRVFKSIFCDWWFGVLELIACPISNQDQRPKHRKHLALDPKTFFRDFRPPPLLPLFISTYFLKNACQVEKEATTTIEAKAKEGSSSIQGNFFSIWLWLSSNPDCSFSQLIVNLSMVTPLWFPKFLFFSQRETRTSLLNDLGSF
jgi:hypothetical protein